MCQLACSLLVPVFSHTFELFSSFLLFPLFMLDLYLCLACALPIMWVERVFITVIAVKLFGLGSMTQHLRTTDIVYSRDQLIVLTTLLVRHTDIPTCT